MSHMSRMFFSQTKLRMLGKKGEIKPDAEGYYTLVVGALNSHNNTGAYRYVADGVRELFGPGSLLHRRIANGCLRAEVNHPKRTAGMSDQQYMDRMLDIDRDNVCAHFKEIWLDENFGKDHPEYGNPSMVAIMAKVKPSEPKGNILRESLENPNENVCFSIRAMADEGFVNGKLIRILKEIVTIDFVNEGGLLVASKWDSPACEAINNDMTLQITEELLKKVMRKDNIYATESSKEAASILLTHFKPSKPPVYSGW